MIYLDNAATSFPKPKSVIEEVKRCISTYCGNPGRSSHNMSLTALEKIYETREEIADFLSFDKPENIVAKCREFCETMDDALLEEIIALYHGWTKWKHNSDINVICSRRQLDFEKWWYIPRPLVGEW